MISVESARKFYENTDSVHDFTHVLRVLALAERLAKEEGADLSIVRTATLLHDISRIEDQDVTQTHAPASSDHAVQAADLAREILKGQPVDFVDAVAHAISAHRFRNTIEPQTIEAKVLFDADKLDAIGAVGVARAFAYGGFLGQPLWGEVSEGYIPGETDEVHTAHHEFRFKLKTIKERLYTQSGRRLAEHRHRVMADFFSEMREEIMGIR